MSKGTLNLGEFHPSATSAMSFVKRWSCDPDSFFTKEAIASNAMSGSRHCQICFETLTRIDNNEPVSDRYLLGLAWFLKELEELKRDGKCDH